MRVGNTPYVAVAGVFIPAAMSRLIDESIVAHKNFQQLDAQRPTLKASQTSLFLAVTLAILFGTLWTSIYASRRITIPIKALAEATGRLAEGGYGHRVEVAATDEVGRLIESFNDMSTQLDAAAAGADADEPLPRRRCSTASPPASSPSPTTSNCSASIARRCRCCRSTSRRRARQPRRRADGRPRAALRHAARADRARRAARAK